MFNNLLFLMITPNTSTGTYSTLTTVINLWLEVQHNTGTTVMFRPLEHLHNTFCIFQAEFPAILEQSLAVVKHGGPPATSPMVVLAKIIKRGLTMNNRGNTYIRRGVALISNREMGGVLSRLSKVPLVCESITANALQKLTGSYDLTVSILGMPFTLSNIAYCVDFISRTTPDVLPYTVIYWFSTPSIYKNICIVSIRRQQHSCRAEPKHLHNGRRASCAAGQESESHAIFVEPFRCRRRGLDGPSQKAQRLYPGRTYRYQPPDAPDTQQKMAVRSCRNLFIYHTTLNEHDCLSSCRFQALYSTRIGRLP
jgi:hypothetical protein